MAGCICPLIWKGWFPYMMSSWRVCWVVSMNCTEKKAARPPQQLEKTFASNDTERKIIFKIDFSGDMLVLWRVTQLYIICPTIVPYGTFFWQERERERANFYPSKKRYRFKFGCMFLKGQILPIKLLIYVYLEPFDDPAVLIGISTCFFLEGEKPLRWRTNRFHVYRYNIYIYTLYILHFSLSWSHYRGTKMWVTSVTCWIPHKMSLPKNRFQVNSKWPFWDG